MKIRHDGKTLNVSDLDQLGTMNRQSFNSELAAALPMGIDRIVIDLSRTGYMDCGGLGALIALRNCARRRHGNVAIRLLNPTPPVRHIFKLTHLDRVFPIESG